MWRCPCVIVLAEFRLPFTAPDWPSPWWPMCPIVRLNVPAPWSRHCHTFTIYNLISSPGMQRDAILLLLLHNLHFTASFMCKHIWDSSLETSTFQLSTCKLELVKLSLYLRRLCSELIYTRPGPGFLHYNLWFKLHRPSRLENILFSQFALMKSVIV